MLKREIRITELSRRHSVRITCLIPTLAHCHLPSGRKFELYGLPALREQTSAGVCFVPQMGLWSRLQQWVYGRPRVAVAGAIVLLLLAGAGGWESARVASPGTTRAAVAPAAQGVAGARMIQVEAAVGPVTRVVHRTRTITAPGPTNTVVRRRTRTRTLRDTSTIRDIVTVTAPSAGRAQPAQAPAVVTRPVRTVTVTTVRTQTQTQTQTQTVTQPPVTVTVFVTTNRGHGH
jgi:hypothetical protein